MLAIPIKVLFDLVINADPLSPLQIDCGYVRLFAQITDFLHRRNGNVLRHSFDGTVSKTAKRNCLDIPVLSLIAPFPMAITPIFSDDSHVVGKFTG